MAHDEEVVVADEPPPARLSKTTLVIIALSVLLGILLVTVVVGGVSYARKAKTLQTEVVALKKDLQGKERLHEEQQAQIEALSRQMSALKEYSVARSDAERSKEDVSVGAPSPAPASAAAVPQANPVVKAPEVPKVTKPEPVVPASSPVQAKVKRPVPEGQSCDLVGKSPEEQSAILKRCVGVMDSPPKGKVTAK